MQRKKTDVDVILDILEATLLAYPESAFVRSLTQQYKERGGLSKKQLQGLYSKATKVKTIPASKMATLEAVILKKPTKFKSAPPPPSPLYIKDEKTVELINSILSKYPQHKRVLYFKTKNDNNEILSATDVAELKKFYKLLKL